MREGLVQKMAETTNTDNKRSGRPRRRQSGAPRRTQGERSAATRGSLLRAALGIIGERGWTAVSTRLVAARAGVTRGALQHYFGSHEDLLKAAVDEMMIQLHQKLNTRELSGRPIEERIERLLQHYYAFYSSGLYSTVLSAALDLNSSINGYLRERIAEEQDTIDRTWREVFADTGLADDELRPVRRLVISTIRGYAIQNIWGRGEIWRQDLHQLRDIILGRLREAHAPGAQ